MEKALFLSELLGFLVVVLPVVIFFMVFAPIFKQVKKMKGFQDLLSDVDEVADRDKEGNLIPGQKAPKRSVSRLILLLSGMTSIVLAVCITSYYFYMNVYCITCKFEMDLTDFTNVLLALGIGVVPYAVNRLKPRNPNQE